MGIKARFANQNAGVNVKDFGAVGDGVTDDTAAIIAADAAAGTGIDGGEFVVFFPPGNYLITALTKTAMWRGENVTKGVRIIWGGADNGGVAITDTSSASFAGFEDIQLRGDGAIQPTNWLQCPPTIDKFYILRRVQILGTRGDAILLTTWINLHWYDVRWDNVGGYAIRCTPTISQNLSTFALEGFTYDHSITASTCEGFIMVDNTADASNIGTFSMNNGRIEVNQPWAGMQAIVTYKATAGTSATRSLGLMISNTTYADSGSMANDVILYRDTANTNGRETLILLNFRQNSLSGVLGGTWPSTQIFPPATPLMAYEINAGDLVRSGFSEHTNRIAESDLAHQVSVGGEAEPRFSQTASGNMSWGPGGATPVDTTMRRSSAGNMRITTGKILADGGLGVGNSAAATTTITLTKKMEVFDEGGASLGFIAIYNSIT